MSTMPSSIERFSSVIGKLRAWGCITIKAIGRDCGSVSYDYLMYNIRPLDTTGTWRSDGARFCESARIMLVELERVAAEVVAESPVPTGVSFDGGAYPELFTKVRHRDALSDSVKIFAAMGIEGFLNFYGVVRLGQDIFDEHFERMLIHQKLSKLLVVCENVRITKSHPMHKHLTWIAGARNDLLHPKAKEFQRPIKASDKNWTAVPGAAQEAVMRMTQFFLEFERAVLGADFLFPECEIEALQQLKARQGISTG